MRASSSAAVKLTYDDFVLFPDDGKRHELIDGEHYVTPSPNTRHQRIVGSLYLLIANWLEVRPIGQIFLAPYDVVFSEFDVVEAGSAVSLERAGGQRDHAAPCPWRPRAGRRDCVERHAQTRRDHQAAVVREGGCLGVLGRRSRDRTPCAFTGGRVIASAGPPNTRGKRATCSRRRYCPVSTSLSRACSGTDPFAARLQAVPNSFDERVDVLPGDPIQEALRAKRRQLS